MNIIKKALATGTLLFSLGTVGCAGAPDHRCGESASSSSVPTHDCKEHPHVACLQRRCGDGVKSIDQLTDPEEIKREIIRAKEDDFYCIAGALEERIGEFGTAVTDYFRAKKYESAALILETQGAVERSRIFFELAFDQYFNVDKCFKCAIKVGEKLEDPIRVSRAKTELLHVKDKEGDYYGAGELAEELGAIETAIAEFEKAGLDERAAELCLKLGNKERALRNYEVGSFNYRKHFGDPKGINSDKIINLAQSLAHDARRSGDEYLALDYYKKASNAGDKLSNPTIARIAHALHRYEEAVTYYKLSGEWESKREAVIDEARKYAGRLFEQGEFDSAVSLAESFSDPHTDAYRKYAQILKNKRKTDSE